jgi:hypothetical protein
MLLFVPLVWLPEVLLVSEPEPLSVVPTLVSGLPWLVSVSCEAQPTNRAAAASMQMICFIVF